MSQFPSMDQPGSTPNPFAAGPPGYPPPRKSSYLWLWILLGLGGVGALVCCGCAGFGLFAFTKGTQMFAENLKTKLNADPVAKEHLGTIDSVELDLMETAKVAKDHPGRNIMLFRVKGSKASGNVIGDSPKPGQDSISNATLVLPDGQELQLDF
jgi:hypothetical protein